MTSPRFVNPTLVLVALALALAPTASHAALAPVELNALADLCNALLPPSWSCADKALACSNWTGIKCDLAGEHVREISLMNLALEGELPYSLGSFSMLEHFYVTKNALYGNIPDNLAGLSNIREMSFANNLMQGSLPASLLRLSTLSKLELSNNRFSGPISKPFALSALVHFDAHSNQFTGFLPNLALSTQLYYFDFGDNKFSGSIPASYGTLKNLNYMDISNNTLQGDLPASMSGLTNLQHINLEGNSFCGCWPFSSNLSLTECSANQISFCCEKNAPTKCSAATCTACTNCEAGSHQCSLSPTASPSSPTLTPGSHRTGISRVFVSASVLLLFVAAAGIAWFAWRRQRVR